MKTAFILVALAACQLAVATNTTDSDTIVVEQPRRVTIICDTDKQSVTVEGAKDDPNFRYTTSLFTNSSDVFSASGIDADTWQFSLGPVKLGKKKQRSSQPVRETAMKFAFGWNNALNTPANMETRTLKSWEIWWIVAEWRYRPWRDNNVFSAGIGLNWRNWRIADGTRFVKDGQQIQLSGYPDGATNHYSRLRVFSVNLPIRYQFRARHAGFSVGPVINLNFKSSIRTEYTSGDQTFRRKDGDAYVSPVTVDLMATARLRWLELYVKYSPMSVLQTNHAPKFQTLSFGIML